jgi:hypothetical protein
MITWNGDFFKAFPRVIPPYPPPIMTTLGCPVSGIFTGIM